MNPTNNIEQMGCNCNTPLCNAENFSISFWATDATNNRFAEISIYTCKHCNSQWVHYFVEYEAYSKSGRWYRCRITPLQLQQLTANNTVDFLEEAAGYFYGGSYFNTTGKYGSGKVKVD